VNDAAQWDKPEVRADFRRMMERQVRQVRNHPSVVIWGTSGNALGISTGDSDPWLLGMQNNTNVQERLDQRARVREAIRMVQKVDPTRAVFGHHSDNGDVHTSNMYLNFLPLQEREEWLSHWAKAGDKPWMAVEFGLPLYASLMRGRDGYTHQGHSEPFLSEWSAVYLGPEAYRLEPAEYRDKIIAGRYKGGDLQREYDPHVRANGGDRIVTQSGSFQKLLDLFITNTWRSWRTLGVTGGMVPWHHDEHPALARVNGPSLAWIAGAGGPPDPARPADDRVFTAKDHSFRVGETIAKQIVLINDHRAPQPYQMRWTATIGGKIVASGSKTGTLAVAETLRLPVTVPTLPSAGTGTITLAAQIGPDKHADTFAFRVFPPAARPAATHFSLTVFDPIGETSALLRSLGYTVRPWKLGQPAPTSSSNSVMVIGRKALSGGNTVPGDLIGFVRNGGRLSSWRRTPNGSKARGNCGPRRTWPAAFSPFPRRPTRS
jgi:beta-galactosidase